MLRWPHLSCLILLSLFMACGSSWRAPAATASSPPQSEPPTASEPSVADSSLLGIVWSPPRSEEAALQALHRIHDTGVTAIRLLHLPEADTIFSRADSLGLHLFVDLPVAYVSASELSDALEDARPTLERIVTLARRHTSVRHVGLARYANTTEPLLCSTLAEWTNRVHTQEEELSTYYVTPFRAPNDHCVDAVDLPLLDVRGQPSPLARWKEWRDGRNRIGLGALGTWTRPNAKSGLRTSHSPEWQARYLERTLSRVLDSTRTLPPAVFVYRWQDQASPLLSSRRYGLHELDGTPRPAASVVQGLYTGTKRVFAFPSGSPPPAEPYTLILLGWGLIAVLGGLYTQSPFIRNTLVRYFTAHGFYRDALRRARKIEGGTHGTLLCLVALAVGTTGALGARGAASLPATEYILAALPSTPQSLLASGLETPSVVGLFFGAATLLLLFSWSLALTFGARRRTRFTFSQGLMLVVWPGWPAPLIMIAALVAATHPPVSPTLLGGGLFFLSLLASVTYTLRVLIDYHAVTEMPLPTVVLMGGLSPLVLSAGVITYLLLYYEVPVFLLWQLATNT